MHAIEVGMECAPDTEILSRAQDENRVLLTADLDFPRLFALLGVKAPGLILFRGGNYTSEEAQEMLERALKTLSMNDIENSVIVLEQDRIRRRELPLRRPSSSR